MGGNDCDFRLGVRRVGAEWDRAGEEAVTRGAADLQGRRAVLVIGRHPDVHWLSLFLDHCQFSGQSVSIDVQWLF